MARSVGSQFTNQLTTGRYLAGLRASCVRDSSSSLPARSNIELESAARSQRKCQRKPQITILILLLPRHHPNLSQIAEPAPYCPPTVLLFPQLIQSKHGAPLRLPLALEDYVATVREQQEQLLGVPTNFTRVSLTFEYHKNQDVDSIQTQARVSVNLYT